MITKSFKPIWLYRGFILGSVKREFQAKYRNSLLGALWTLINPLAMILVYTVIFSQIMHTRLPNMSGSFSYSIYLCSGIFAWGFFSEIVSRTMNIFIDNANLIKKLSFPRLCLPLIVVINASLNFFIVFGLFLAFLVVSKTPPGIYLLAAVPLLSILVMLALGLGVVLGVLNVFFRDVGQFFGIFLQFWFWLTPIIYTTNILPLKAQNLILYNPMTSLIAGFQNIFAFGKWPDWSSLIYPLLLSLVLCLVGLKLFRKHGGDMVDEL